MGLERRPRQAHEPDERGHAGDLDRPEAEALAGEMGRDPGDEGVALGPVQRAGEMLHHRRVGVQGREWLEVVLAPRSEQEAVGPEEWLGHGKQGLPMW